MSSNNGSTVSTLVGKPISLASHNSLISPIKKAPTLRRVKVGHRSTNSFKRSALTSKPVFEHHLKVDKNSSEQKKFSIHLIETNDI